MPQKFGSKAFQQVVDITMGSDPVLFMVNLFPFLLCGQMNKKEQKEIPNSSSKFSNMFRFIDELATINGGGEFEKVYQKLYATKIELKRENRSDIKAFPLDLDINIENKVPS